jgi:hypothetical protein
VIMTSLRFEELHVPALPPSSRPPTGVSVHPLFDMFQSSSLLLFCVIVS